MPSMPGSGTAVPPEEPVWVVPPDVVVVEPPEVVVVPPEVLVVPPEVLVVPPEVLEPHIEVPVESPQPHLCLWNQLPQVACAGVATAMVRPSESVRAVIDLRNMWSSPSSTRFARIVASPMPNTVFCDFFCRWLASIGFIVS